MFAITVASVLLFWLVLALLLHRDEQAESKARFQPLMSDVAGFHKHQPAGQTDICAEVDLADSGTVQADTAANA